MKLVDKNFEIKETQHLIKYFPYLYFHKFATSKKARFSQKLAWFKSK